MTKPPSRSPLANLIHTADGCFLSRESTSRISCALSRHEADSAFARTCAGFVVHADEFGRGSRALRLLKLRDREVRAPDLAHLPGFHQLVQSAESVADRHGLIGAMELI